MILRPPPQGRPAVARHCWFALLDSTPASNSTIKHDIQNEILIVKTWAAGAAHEYGVADLIGGCVEFPVGYGGGKLDGVLVHRDSLVAVHDVVNLGIKVHLQ